MKRKLKLLLILITGIIDILFITAQVWALAVNFKWSPWYDSKSMFLAMMMLIHPIMLVIIVLLLGLNFALYEMQYNSKILLISIGSHFLIIITFVSIISHFENTSYYFTVLNLVLTLALVEFIILICLSLVNLIKVCYRIIKGEPHCYHKY